MDRSAIARCALVAVVLLLVCDVAMACPNCRDAMAEDPLQAGLARGFFWSILFMLSMPVLILSGIGGYFYWEVCRARRAVAAGVATGALATVAGSPFAIDQPSDSASELSAFSSDPVGAEQDAESALAVGV